MKLYKLKTRPIFEFQVFPYKDKLVAHCICNRCGEHFSMTLRANENAMPYILADEKLVKHLLIIRANVHHQCDEDSYVQDPAETNRIVNKYHEYKIKIKKAFGEEPK